MIVQQNGSNVDVVTALRRIKRQFGDEYDVIITDDDIYGWIYEAESDIIRNTGCNDTKLTVSSTSFPSNVPAAVNIKRISISGKALQYISVAEIDLLGLSVVSTGGPGYWYKEKSEVCLWPVAETAVNVEIHYNKVPNAMSGDPVVNVFTVPDVYHDDVIKYCIGRAHNKNNNLQAEQVQMALYDKSLPNRRDEAQSVDLILYKGADPMDFEEVS